MAQALLPKLLKLAHADDVSLQCSVLKVLRELKLSDKLVSALFIEKISSASPDVRRHALEGLLVYPTFESCGVLLDLIDKNDSNFAMAENILSKMGGKVVSQIKKRISVSDERAIRSYISILIKIYTIEARNVLLDMIFDNTVETLKHICFLLREKFEATDESEKESLFALLKVRVERAEKEKKYSALTSYVILLGYLRYAASKSLFVSLCLKSEREYFHVRRNALIALSRLDLQKKHDDVAKALFCIAANGDSSLVKTAAEILARIQFSPIFDKEIEALLSSNQPEVKRFAIIALGRKNNKKTILQLITFLHDADMSVRDAALESLKANADSVAFLLPLLDSIVSETELVSVANILKHHRQKLTPEKCKALYSKLDKFYAQGNQRYQTFYTVFRIAYPEYLYKTVLRKVQLLKGRKRFKEAEHFAQLISRGLMFTDDVKYETAIVQLKNSAHELALLNRSNDNCLKLFEHLLKSSDIALLKRIKKETVLDATDFFYVGFHFSEKFFELKDFGVEILKFCIKKYPRTKITTKAKKKLEIVGIAVSS